jgi:hypothetical protein
MNKQTQLLSIETNMLFELTYIMESMLIDLQSDANAQGKNLRFEAKRYFNTAIRSVRSLLAYVKEFKDGQKKEDFGREADELAYILLLINDRVSSDKDMDKFISTLEEMPSQLGLDLTKYKNNI